MLNHYSGAWVSGADGFTATFTHNTTTGQSQATANWDLGGDLDWGGYPSLAIPLHPRLLYQAYSVQASFFTWRARLDITG